MNTFYEASYIIKKDECNQDGLIKTEELQNILQKITEIHSASMGFGFQQMEQKGYFFVVSRVFMELMDCPKLEDEVMIQTWVNQPSASGIIRNYFMFDKNSNLIYTPVFNLASLSIVDCSNKSEKIDKNDKNDKNEKGKSNIINDNADLINKYTLPDSNYATSLPALKDLSKSKSNVIIKIYFLFTQFIKFITILS